MEALATSSHPTTLLLGRHRRRLPASFPAVLATASLGGRFPFLRHSLPCGFSSRLPSLSCFSLSHSSLGFTGENDEAFKFAEAANNGNLVPLFRSIFSDHLTPVLAYRCLVKEDERDAPSFLFESVEQGSMGTNVVSSNSCLPWFLIAFIRLVALNNRHGQGRYSVVGAQPAMEIVAKEYSVSIMDHEEGHMTEEIVEDPMLIPRKIMESWSPQLITELPDVFCGGWAGYFSYDTVRYVEKKKLPFTNSPRDDRNLPDVHLGLYNDVIVFDHVEKLYVAAMNAVCEGEGTFTSCPTLSAGSVKLSTYQFGAALTKSSMTSEEYKTAVLHAKEHIFAGDIFQIVLSQRFERRTFADPFEVYRALRIVNPSPYMAYLQVG
ncbi:hypothetical protein ZIOFF_011076 [Zingiber officinale]|uniref:Uncharacterized protein n=1 Tax=Zingiber officinale TaxID=94328 RepID=A0A8J5HMU3_ZINOF|nr:hypothetical protein ZIOFF_011076 [Zingiber officinale]